jgi:hypothetical protein
MADRRVVLFMRRLPIDEIICMSGRGPEADIDADETGSLA